MNYKAITYFINEETGEEFRDGDIVTINFPDGGGFVGCLIHKVTNKGFHYSQGSGRKKSIQFNDVDEIYKT